MSYESLEALAEAAEDLCRQKRVLPISAQAGEALSLRTLRYYRTMGLLDGAGGDGYGEKHLLQLIAIRVLQAMGQPLRRIQVLLAGRSLADLRKIQTDGIRELSKQTAPTTSWPVQNEAWSASVVDEEWLLVSRKGRHLSDATIAQIRTLLTSITPSRNALL